MGALVATADDRLARWTTEDIEKRLDFALRSAFAHGTAAIRTHLDSGGPRNDAAWDLFEAMRARWAGRIELQAVALIGPDQMADNAVVRPVAQRAKAAGGLLGGAVGVHPLAREAIYKIVEVAGELGLDLDVHCDETLDPAASTLRYLADAVIDTGFAGKVVAGHCCALSTQDEAVARATMERVAEAGIAVVSLPMCNLYLQDRGPGTPLYRGVTLVNELRALGVPVALASDNTRDPFYAYGDLDVLEVLREGTRIAHFDHPADAAWTWVRAVTADAAAIAGFGYTGTLAVDGPADLVLFGARNWTELLSRPQADRVVLRGGAAIDTALPDYRELDELMEP
jgi:cytosine deaminase